MTADVTAEARRRSFTGQAGTRFVSASGSGRARRTVVVVGLGPAAEVTPETLRLAAAAGMRDALASRAAVVAATLPGPVGGLDTRERAAAVAEGLALAAVPLRQA